MPPAHRSAADAACQLQSPGSQIKHIVHITFDNVHLRRDNPNVPSDLEQMPNLLNFILNNGVISGNHHTPLISHTATDILTALTGNYGDRMGVPVANSYGFFGPDGTVSIGNPSFLYWTSPSTSRPATGGLLMIDKMARRIPRPGCPSPVPAATLARSRSPTSSSKTCRPISTPYSVRARADRERRQQQCDGNNPNDNNSPIRRPASRLIPIGSASQCTAHRGARSAAAPMGRPTCSPTSRTVIPTSTRSTGTSMSHR